MALPKRTPIEWVLIIFVIVATAARESGVIPNEPWGKFIGLLIAGLYTWGILGRPSQAKGPRGASQNGWSRGARLILPFLLLFSLGSCALFQAPDASAAGKGVQEMEALYLKQSRAFSKTIAAAKLDEAKKKLFLERIRANEAAFKQVSSSTLEYLAEVGRLDWKDLYEGARKIIEEVKK